jgi:hypothetical protein
MFLFCLPANEVSDIVLHFATIQDIKISAKTSETTNPRLRKFSENFLSADLF